MGKNYYSKIISQAKKELLTADTDFSRLLKSSPGFSQIEAFIRNRYFTIAYLYAFSILNNRYTDDDLLDKIGDMVTAVLEPIIGDVRNGTFSFKGGSSFSTYLYAALKRASRVRVSIPLPIQREGSLAIEVYELVYRRMSESEIIRNKKTGSGQSEALIRRYITQAKEYLGKKAPIEYERSKSIESYDRILAEPERYREPGTGSDAFTDYMAQHVKDELSKALKTLSPDEQELINEHYLEGKSLAEIGQRLGMQNPVYEKNKALKKLRDPLKNLKE